MKNFILFIVTLLAIVTTASAQSNNGTKYVHGTSEWADAAGEIFVVEAVSYATVITPTKSGEYFYSIRALDAQKNILRKLEFYGSAIYRDGVLCVWDSNDDFYISLWGRIPVVESYN